MKEFVVYVVKNYHGIIQVINVEFVRTYCMRLEVKGINQYLEVVGEEIVLVRIQEKEEIDIS